jgi:DNA-binding beta-propeller fold protein YncE
MSKITLEPNSSGTGTFTLAAPDSDTNRTLTLPDSAGELLTATGDGSGLTGIVIPTVPPIFDPVAVSGATHALDVGSYNFFNAGPLTANTTVSFTSVPTNARWSYSFVPAIASGQWDVSAAIQKGSFSVASQDQIPQDVFFKPDGTKMYVLGFQADKVFEYDLSTAWDVETATYVQGFSVSSQEQYPKGVFFKPDGTKMYVIGYYADSVFEYNLSTAWDVSTSSYLQSFSASSQDSGTHDVFFKPDGLKLYVLGGDNYYVYEYNLSTAWDVSTSSYSQSFYVGTQETGPNGIFFKPDGTKLYVVGITGDDVNEYDLSTAWDVSTASYLQTFYVGSFESYPCGVFFKPDGEKMYVVGESSDKVHVFQVGSVSTLTLPSSVVGTTNAIHLDSRHTYEFFTMDGGTTVELISQERVL